MGTKRQKTSRTKIGLNVVYFAECTKLNGRLYKDVEYSKIKQPVKVYELREFDFFVAMSFQQYAFLQYGQHLDKN